MSAVDTLPVQAPTPSVSHTQWTGWLVSSLRDVAYAGAVLTWSVAGFSILVCGLSITASLLVLVIGVLAWIAFIHIMRWTTGVDRRLAAWRCRAHVPVAVHRHPSEPGPIAYVRTLSCDPQTWKDLSWLGLNSVLGFAYGLLVVTSVGMVVAYVAMPAWYWAVSHPHTQYGLTNLGLFTVDTLGNAAIASAIGLALLPVVLLVARAGARFHSRLAVRVLASTTTAMPESPRSPHA